jgi:glycosyltransferase involved in cell wall biosynthesis
VVGIAGSLAWSARRRYCYGLELAAAARHVRRPGVRFLVVGDGPGRPHLDRLAAAAPPGRVLFAGRRPQAELPDWYAAMDLASLPQSTDAVGAVRYTTKLSEYLAAGLGVTVGPVPMAYDLDAGWAWRVPGGEPWEPGYHRALAALIDALTPAEIAAKAAAARAAAGLFDRDRQVDRVTAFLSDLLADR